MSNLFGADVHKKLREAGYKKSMCFPSGILDDIKEELGDKLTSLTPIYGCSQPRRLHRWIEGYSAHSGNLFATGECEEDACGNLWLALKELGRL